MSANALHTDLALYRLANNSLNLRESLKDFQRIEVPADRLDGIRTQLRLLIRESEAAVAELDRAKAALAAAQVSIINPEVS